MKFLIKLITLLTFATPFLGQSNFALAKVHGEQDLKTLFIELGKAVNPAVVNIFTTQVMRNPYGPGRGMPVDPFDLFFGGMGPYGRGAPGREQKASSLGSGFIIDESGLIVTNNHVIQNATDIQVQLVERSKKTFKAKVIGKDERSDIAIIKIEYPGKLTAIPLGDSDKVEVGEWVAAFGNPFGHGHTMTKGIISAKERDVETENAPNFPFLQTDASINPGNSGGPLVNTKGEVIGVNSAIDQRAQGIGFAIPINVFKKLLPELKSKGRVTRGFLGVGISNINEQIAKELGLKSDEGALVTAITPGSPADRAGLQPYDVFVEYNGKVIEDAKQLMVAVTETKVGDTVSAKIYRDGKPQKVSIKILEKDSDETPTSLAGRKSLPQVQTVDAPHKLGISMADLTPSLARQLEITVAPKKAVVILEIKNGSVAQQAGLAVGDIILDVNRKPVTQAKDAAKAFQKGGNSLRVLRGPNTMIVFMGGEE